MTWNQNRIPEQHGVARGCKGLQGAAGGAWLLPQCAPFPFSSFLQRLIGTKEWGCHNMTEAPTQHAGTPTCKVMGSGCSGSPVRHATEPKPRCIRHSWSAANLALPATSILGLLSAKHARIGINIIRRCVQLPSYTDASICSSAMLKIRRILLNCYRLDEF